jgi:hypothetical protein
MIPCTKQEWSEVHQIACDIANSSLMDDDVLVAHHHERMTELLDRLDAIYGPNASLIATRADYADDLVERRQLYDSALKLARYTFDTTEEVEILESIAALDSDDTR